MIDTNRKFPYLRMDRESRTALYLGYVLPLTTSEYEVLRAIADSDGFCSKKQVKSVIEECGTEDVKISLSSIPVHVFSINKKSVLSGGRKIIESRKNRGYIINPNM